MIIFIVKDSEMSIIINNITNQFTKLNYFYCHKNVNKIGILSHIKSVGNLNG